jgi:hypothetical protein
MRPIRINRKLDFFIIKKKKVSLLELLLQSSTDDQGRANRKQFISIIGDALPHLHGQTSTTAEWRLVTCVASEFGKDSDEYEMSGSSRKTDIRKSARSTNAAKLNQSGLKK